MLVKHGENNKTMKLWKLKHNRIECLLCPHQCLLENGEAGKCLVRKAEDDKIILDFYGYISSIAAEPIEKKPFKKFIPGTRTLSVGTYGCSLSCDFCENHLISQSIPSGIIKKYSPQKIVDIAKKEKCQSVCMTYNEPTVHYEYLMDLSELCDKSGLFFILKTNGYVNKKPWKKICKFTYAINIDWKGGPAVFRTLTGGSKLFNIYYNIKIALEELVHIEISIPIYSGMDREQELSLFASTLATLNKDIPCHLLPITPSYRMENSLPTMKEEILQTKKILSQYLTNIYT